MAMWMNDSSLILFRRLFLPKWCASFDQLDCELVALCALYAELMSRGETHALWGITTV